MINKDFEKYEFIAADITNNCNLRCQFCFNEFEGDNVFMHGQTYEKVLELLPLVDEGNFYISCLYEPTIHPHFIQFLEKIPEKYLKKVFFTTNLATKISNKTIESLSQINLHHINISIDSFNQTVFENLRKGANYNRFIYNLERLTSIFSDSDNAPPIRYITVALQSNLDEIPMIAEKLAENYLATMHEVRWIYWGSHKNPSDFDIEWKKNNLISNDDWDMLQKYAEQTPLNVIVTPPLPDYYPDDKQPYSRNSKCTDTFPLALSISSNGTVSPLGHDEIYYNINDIDNPCEFFIENMKYHKSLPKINICMDTFYDNHS